jgi:hypothetical protein
MKTLIMVLLAALAVMTTSSFDCESTRKVLLVLENPMQEETFSVFTVNDNGEVLIGENTDEYPVPDGVYKIIGSSNDKFFNHKIMISK